jgi:multiple sugar transport system substrate-binding protein
VDRRRFLGLATATGMAGAVGATATGCGVNSGSAATLKLVAADYGKPGGDNSSRAYWDELVHRFHKKHPDIRVDVSVYSWNEVDKKVAELVKAGHAPDMAQIGTYANYAADNKLYSASDLLSIPIQADFVQSLAEAGEVRHVQYGMPFVSSTRLLFYNKKLFTKAGLDPDSPPETWDQLEGAASRLKAAGVEIPYGLPLGREEAQAEAMLWMLGGGGAYTDKVGSYTINATENIETFEWLRDHLVAKKLTNDDPGGTDRQDLFDAFSRGAVGMLNGHPTLMRQAKRGHVSYGTSVVPGKHGPSPNTLGVADWMMAFKQNGKREQIGAFLDFLYGEKNHYALADRYDILPVTISASRHMRRSTKHKKLWRFLDELSSADFYPVGKVSWTELSARIKKRIGDAVEKDGDPAAVLGALQRKGELEDTAEGGL